jgi:hypothetical protein
MTKEQILSKVKALAKENGGHVSKELFKKETGLHEAQFLGKYWLKWNDLLVEAGLQTKSFSNPKIDDNIVLEAFSGLIEKLGKWPTIYERNFERNNNPEFPSDDVFRRFRKEKSLPLAIEEYCESHNVFPLAAKIAREKMESEKTETSIAKDSPITGYVYMMKSGRRYKIGKTNSPSRRHREVKLDLPDPTTLIHSISTDDPTGIEAYWHKRFASMRVRDTEFFELDASDVAAFKRRKYQ